MFGSFLVGAGCHQHGCLLPAATLAHCRRAPLVPQVLLTLDDDLDCVQRDKIYVF